MKTIVVLVLITFFPAISHAEGDVPLAKDSPAPFTGVLVTTDSYGQVIKDKADLDKFKIETDTLKQLQDFKDEKNKEILDLKQREADAWKKQAEENAKRSFLEQHGFQIGVAVGAVLTIAVAFAAAQAIKAR